MTDQQRLWNHFEAKGGTYFSFRSDMSGDVGIHRRPEEDVECVSGPDLLEFARWYAVEYAGVSSEPKPFDETVGTVEVRGGSSDPTKLGEVLYGLLEEAAARQAPVVDLEALRESDKLSVTDCNRCGKRLAAGGYCTMACADGRRGDLAAAGATHDLYTGAPLAPTRRPARDVAHDILKESWWHPCPAMSKTEAADAIVAIIRADRKGE